MRRSTTVPLIARQKHVDSLLAAVERAAAGRPGLALIGGDAGVGKSRLIGHIVAAAEAGGASTVVVHCVDLGQVGIPYLPFTEALSQLRSGAAGAAAADGVARLAAERPALWRLLEPGGEAGADHDERLQLFDGIARSLGVAGEPGRPLVLVVEDVHWADASTRDVLRFLAVRARAENLLVVVTYRSDDVDRRHPLRPLLAELVRLERVERLDLDPFDDTELREFTTALAGTPLEASAFSDVLERSEGNAFFAEELLEAGPGGDALPWTLTEVLRARLERLDAQVQQVVRLASVAGRRVREETLRAAAEHWGEVDFLDAALREAVTQQVLVVSGGHLEFRHALLAEVLYTDLLPGECSAMHRAYLAALSEPGSAGPPRGGAAERAHHAFEAHELAAALIASHEAALDARGLLAPSEELRHREQALKLWESVPDAEQLLGLDLAEAATLAGEAAAKAGDPMRSIRLTRRAIDEVSDSPARHAALQHVLVRRYLELPEWGEHAEDCVAALRGALEVLPDPSPDRVWSDALLARIALALDQDDESRGQAELAVAGARALGEYGALSEALATLATLHVADSDRAAGLLDEARAAAVQAGDALAEIRCLFNVMANRFYAGHLHDAEQKADHAIARAEELGLSWSAYGVQVHIVREVISYIRGDLAARPVGDVPPTSLRVLESARMYAAVARGDEAIGQGEALLGHWRDDGMIALIGGGCLVDAYTWAGRYDDALELAERIIDHLGAVWNNLFLGGIWLAALAISALADAAQEDRISGRVGDPARLTRGDELLARARQTARKGRPRGGALGPEGAAWLQRAAAENSRLHAVAVGAADGAAQRWRAAADSWLATVKAFDFGYRYELCRSRYRWAEAMMGAGERDAAAAAATEALTEADSMGAAPLAAAIRAFGRRARLDLPGTRRSTPSTLTGREVEVLTLVARGLSNRQVGEQLYISTKTVSVHMSNIMAKFGASGRAEAVSLAHRRGLLDE